MYLDAVVNENFRSPGFTSKPSRLELSKETTFRSLHKSGHYTLDGSELIMEKKSGTVERWTVTFLSEDALVIPIPETQYRAAGEDARVLLVYARRSDSEAMPTPATGIELVPHPSLHLKGKPGRPR